MMKGNTIDFGSVQVSKTVLEEIVFSVLKEIDGANLVKDPIGKRIFGFLTKKNSSGVDIKVDGGHGVTIDVKIEVGYGKNIPAIATEVQDAIRAVIEKTVDINLIGINVNVQGITKVKTKSE